MTQLKRSIPLSVLALFGLGNILGAGIYVLIGVVAAKAAMYTPIAFLLAALVALFSALAFAEMSARYPLSAGPAVYVDAAFHSDSLARLVGLLIAAAGIVSAATITRGFYGYFSHFFSVPDWIVIVTLIGLLGSLVIWGISQSATTAALLTLIEIFGLLLIIWVGRENYLLIPERWNELVPSWNMQNVNMIVPAAFLAFYAFLGFEDIVHIAEEAKNPTRNMPRAILLALLLATLFYVAVATVAVLAVPSDQLAEADAPLLLVLGSSSNSITVIFTVIAMIAVVNGAIIQMIMASRVFYGMACKNWLPEWLATVNPKTRTPIRATLLVTTIILMLALSFPLAGLAAVTSLLVLGVFVLVNVALVILKLRGVGLDSIETSYPVWVPLMGAVLSVLLVVSSVLL